MPRKLLLNGNTVYELDEECMLQQKCSEYDKETLAVHVNKEDEEKAVRRQNRKETGDAMDNVCFNCGNFQDRSSRSCSFLQQKSFKKDKKLL